MVNGDVEEVPLVVVRVYDRVATLSKTSAAIDLGDAISSGWGEGGYCGEFGPWY